MEGSCSKTGWGGWSHAGKLSTLTLLRGVEAKGNRERPNQELT